MKLPSQILSLLCTTILIAASSCSSKKAVPTLSTEDVKYSLKKSACFGKCPVYQLDIYEGGRAVLNGQRYIEPMGTSEKQLSEAAFADLEAAFASTDFHNFPDTVPSMIPDLPSVWVTYYDGVSTKTVYGKEGRPDEVVELEALMNSIAMSPGWKTTQPAKKPASRATDASGVIEHQLIMQPIDNMEISENWLKRYKQHKLTLVKRLSPDLNYYLLEYDTKTIAPAAMIELMQGDPAVKVVQFNKEVTMREPTTRGGK